MLEQSATETVELLGRMGVECRLTATQVRRAKVFEVDAAMTWGEGKEGGEREGGSRLHHRLTTPQTQPAKSLCHKLSTG